MKCVDPIFHPYLCSVKVKKSSRLISFFDETFIIQVSLTATTEPPETALIKKLIHSFN